MSRIATSGKRKEALAKIILTDGVGNITVNKKPFDDYFKGYPFAKHEVIRPLIATDTRKKYDCLAHVSGGGISGQAQAIRHGISKALVKLSEEHRKALRKEGLLTRDSRVVERKKPGRPKARKRFQYSKR
ncbi:MAG: 30S ribosomal protein S9 [Elusimicrobia bacterium CG08_land_8_20_14_0_20_44_26]|nr:MAG: 30S ribosomal protein S9 [Elusimicrobia bacterium CG08_land_8_20_14_0_20_44_26]